jgi:DNA-directed RNA polymerase subunit omega
MLRPTDIENLKGNNSRYAVVVGVAKRAREIADEAESDGTILIEKTVSLAINDFKGGDYKLVVSNMDGTHKK